MYKLHEIQEIDKTFQKTKIIKYEVKNPPENSSKLIPTIYKNDHTPWSNGWFIPRIQGWCKFTSQLSHEQKEG